MIRTQTHELIEIVDDLAAVILSLIQQNYPKDGGPLNARIEADLECCHRVHAKLEHLKKLAQIETEGR